MTQPDLTLQTLGGKVTQRNELKYATQSQCSEARHIPLAILKLAKTQGAPGFHYTKSEISWTKLQPWLSEHYTELLNVVEAAEKKKNPPIETTREKLELQMLKEKLIEIKQKNRKNDITLIQLDLVCATFQKVIDEWSKVMTRYFVQEQPTKCGGMTEPDLRATNIEILKKAFTKLQTPLNEWEQGKHLHSEDTQAPKEGDTNAG